MTVSAARKAGDGILDEFQTAFCDSPAENIRLLAPAGSGKTMSLLWRCLSVYQAKGGSARFLVFTFTRAARDELRKRLASHQFNNIRSAIEIATLNSWGFKRVKQNFHSPRLNTTEAERSFCVQNALQPVWMRHDYVRKAIQAQAFSAGKTIMNLMDLMKSMAFLHRNSEKEIHQHLEALTAIGLRPILEYAFRDLRTNEDAFAQFDEQFKAFVPFWREACQHLIEQSMFTLEDQKYVALLDLQDQRKAGRRPVGAARITHLLIDEFQDINPLDLALIRELADWHGSALTIVGDDDQCIFEWRGATFRYIVEPKIHLAKDFHTFILEKNYRCPRNIVSHSQSLIKINKRRVSKRVEAMHKKDAQVTIFGMPSFAEALDKVMEAVLSFYKQVESGKLPKDSRIALVARKRAQLIPYQILLASKDIPFCAAEDLQVFLSGTFNKLIDLLSVFENMRKRERPRQITEDLLLMCDLVKRYPLKKSEKSDLERYFRTKNFRSHMEALDILSEFRGQLKGSNDDGAMSRSFADAVRQVISQETVSDALEALGSELKGLEKDYGKSHEDIFYADPPFYYLTQFAKRYGDDFDRFIEDLDSAARQLAQLPTDEDAESSVWAAPIHLMTALRAKGKEFHTVVLLDVNDGIWPSIHAETQEQKEQERRVFYVAMTRAKEELVMTWSGRFGDKRGIRSPFIEEAGFS